MENDRPRCINLFLEYEYTILSDKLMTMHKIIRDNNRCLSRTRILFKINMIIAVKLKNVFKIGVFNYAFIFSK